MTITSDIDTADSADNEKPARSIAVGFTRGHSEKHLGFLIHVSGAEILIFADTDEDKYGELSTKIYNGLEGIEEITTTMPDHALHRNVDRLILAAAANAIDCVKVAIVSPVTVYDKLRLNIFHTRAVVDEITGSGRGPVSTRSRQVNLLAKTTLQNRQAPAIGAGESVGRNIHIYDLTEVIIKLAEEAVKSESNDQLWGPETYYFAENGEHIWSEVARAIATIANDKDLIPSPET